MNERPFDPEAFMHFSDAQATVTKIVMSERTSIAVWGVRPGRKVPAHIHPDGQDAWIMLRGPLNYHPGNGQQTTILADRLDGAEHHQVHGAINDDGRDAMFLSNYSAPKLGWERATP